MQLTWRYYCSAHLQGLRCVEICSLWTGSGSNLGRELEMHCLAYRPSEEHRLGVGRCSDTLLEGSGSLVEGLCCQQEREA